MQKSSPQISWGPGGEQTEPQSCENSCPTLATQWRETQAPDTHPDYSMSSTYQVQI